MNNPKEPINFDVTSGPHAGQDTLNFSPTSKEYLLALRGFCYHYHSGQWSRLYELGCIVDMYLERWYELGLGTFDEWDKIKGYDCPDYDIDWDTADRWYKHFEKHYADI